MREGFTTEAFRRYVPLFVNEVTDYVMTSPRFKGQTGESNITDVLAEMTIYTAAASLQGKEIRSKFDTTFATLYRHLDDGFQPINFVMPWLPLPQNRRRDHARRTMERLYSEIIQRRRQEGNSANDVDMLWTLMGAYYKDGSKVPDEHVSRLMIALLMAGQHNTAASGAWILLHLANKPDIIEKLYQEQKDVLGWPLPPLSLEALQKLKLNDRVIKETLRLHSPIHSIMRQVTRPLHVPDTKWTIPPSHVLLACPSFLAQTAEFFERPLEWDPSRWEVGSSSDKDETRKSDDPETDIHSKAATSPYLPFGAGRHRCTGEQYAYVQLGTIVATMVRLLEWEQVDPKASVPKPDYSVSKPSAIDHKPEADIGVVHVYQTHDTGHDPMAPS